MHLPHVCDRISGAPTRCAPFQLPGRAFPATQPQQPSDDITYMLLAASGPPRLIAISLTRNSPPQLLHYETLIGSSARNIIRCACLIAFFRLVPHALVGKYSSRLTTMYKLPFSLLFLYRSDDHGQDFTLSMMTRRSSALVTRYWRLRIHKPAAFLSPQREHTIIVIFI